MLNNIAILLLLTTVLVMLKYIRNLFDKLDDYRHQVFTLKDEKRYYIRNLLIATQKECPFCDRETNWYCNLHDPRPFNGDAWPNGTVLINDRLRKEVRIIYDIYKYGNTLYYITDLQQNEKTQVQLEEEGWRPLGKELLNTL